MAVTPALPSPREAARGESRQRKSSTAGAAGSCTLAGIVFALAQHPSSVGSVFPAAPRVRLFELPCVYRLPSFLRQNSRGFFGVLWLLLAALATADRTASLLALPTNTNAYVACLDAPTCLNGPGQKSSPGARGQRSSREGVNKGCNTKRPHSKAQVRASCTPPPGLHPAAGALAVLHHSSASFPTELLPHLCDVKQSFCFLFKTLASGAITGKKGSWGSFI